ncbi:50S ribosomal protein L32 [Candidatus Nomurabacteria bacterium RIFCSPLOWO2_01_FULL_36_10b]|uniref:Large ribosomal subunit protein bL32 n=1 Tax=Candidatus Nomurabacteria bacterium RIFCSPLOWO2_01_FULL_36_10b TaxID=1801766 RepID=A0A1F6WQE7_9BACT|nr:MAG: 50S ribosomal protein L32 [Candidatus Nomurabacteria bacterium RIFCSPLOWO2_01_FULL_36_10b]
MVIRMRHTRAHTANRRSHHALVTPTLRKCENCSALKLPHRACMECGTYRGKNVIDVVAKTKKRQAKIKKREG